jgi:hypothetical protein
MRSFVTTGCDHKNSKYAPSRAHTNCTVCGAVRTDSGRDWGVAANAWFDDLASAEFYKRHGRIPDQPKQST